MSFILQRVRDDPGAGAGEIGRTSMVQFVEQPMLVIGRGANADLRFSETSVALAHAVIRPSAPAGVSRDGGLEVADSGSLTGTYLNGKRVDRAPLANGDWLEIGRHRLTIQLGQPGAPHTVLIRELAAEVAVAREAAVEVSPGSGTARGAPLRATPIDHLTAYGLGRPLLGRAALSVWAGLLVGIALLGLLVSRQTAAFRPGSVSSAHAAIASDCAACHAGWRGPDDRRCTVCHAAPAHQPNALVPAGLAAAPPIGPLADARDADSPSCGTCHVEHRFEPVLARVDNARCVSCHRALAVRDGTPGQRFAVKVTDFATDHPQFALDVHPPDQAGVPAVRVSLDRDEARRGDPAVFWLNHALHLRPDLKGPQGPEQLDCLRSCHTPERASDAILPVNYERNCQRCHRLVFDPRFPDAPHTSAEKLHAFLVRTYAERQDQAGPGGARPLRVQRRLLPRGGGSDASGDALAAALDVDARVLRQVVEAEINLYRSACAKCHEVDLGGATPAITPIDLPRRWFPYASFSHQSHRQSECTLCHGRAVTSKETADVLLPGIEVCRTCHGPQATAAGQRAGATTQCVRCHAYHDASRTGAWGKTPRGAWEAGSGAGAP